MPLSVSSISRHGQAILPRTRSESFEALPAPTPASHLQTTGKSYGPTFKAYPESDHFSSLPLIQQNVLLTWMITKPPNWSWQATHPMMFSFQNLSQAREPLGSRSLWKPPHFTWSPSPYTRPPSPLWPDPICHFLHLSPYSALASWLFHKWGRHLTLLFLHLSACFVPSPMPPDPKPSLTTPLPYFFFTMFIFTWQSIYSFFTVHLSPVECNPHRYRIFSSLE